MAAKAPSCTPGVHPDQHNHQETWDTERDASQQIDWIDRFPRLHCALSPAHGAPSGPTFTRPDAFPTGSQAARRRGSKLQRLVTSWRKSCALPTAGFCQVRPSFASVVPETGWSCG
jgi:hypothetical protein